MTARPQLPPNVTPSDLARAIIHLRARGRHEEADYLASFLPPVHDHFGGAAPVFSSPNGTSFAPDPDGPDGPNAGRVPYPDNAAGGGSLGPKVDKAYEVFGRAAPEPAPHKYGCVFLPMPEDISGRIMALGKMIPDDDLADSGREVHPHVTLIYGL